MENQLIAEAMKIGAFAAGLIFALKWTVTQLLSAQSRNAELQREAISNGIKERKDLLERCAEDRIEASARIRLLEDKIEGLLVTHLEQSTRALNFVGQAMRDLGSPSGKHLAVTTNPKGIS